MNKRILAILIALVVLVCFAAFTVSAAEPGTRTQCECGGTAVGKLDHTCSNIEFLPWSDSTKLPAEGNYYLTCDVELTEQFGLNKPLRLDLNGHNIVHKVTNTDESRVFSMYGANANLSITDSTDKPGTITRDLSALDQAAQEGIDNYGLLFLVANDVEGSTDNPKGTLNLYNGIFDATGQYTGGGAVISNLALNFTTNIYGGDLRGGLTKKIAAGIYSDGHVNMFGGKLTGGIAYNSSKAATGGIHITVTPGQGRYLTLSGDAVIKDNYRIDDDKKYEANTKIRWGQLYMTGKFTGCVSVTCVDSSQNVITDPANSDYFTSNPFFHNGGANKNTFDITDGIVLIDNEPDIAGKAKNGQIWIAEARNQCECGGKAVGKYGHTCKLLSYFPTETLPTTAGNYYLTKDISYTSRKDYGAGVTVRIDLNGNDLVRKVSSTSGSSSMFGATTSSGAVQLVITDSTDKVGTVTRDLSALSQEDQEGLRNYGLLFFVQNITGGGITLYDGTYDFDGHYCDSSSVIYNASSKSTVNIYGGEIRCGITPTGKDPAIYSNGPVGLYGGSITGAKFTGSNNGAVEMGNNSNMLTISGDVNVTGNSIVTITNGNFNAVSAANIFAKPSQIRLVGEFTGNIGISPVSGSNRTTATLGMVLGDATDAKITPGTITVDGYNEFNAKIVDGKLVVNSAYGAITDHGMNTYYYDTLAEAIADYPGGMAVIRLMSNRDEEVTFPANAYMDLNGNNIKKITVADSATVYTFDSMTSDYTVEDGQGYGKVGSFAGNLTALPQGTAISQQGYMQITEADGTSFHCLYLETTAMSLRASAAGIYYTSCFGGDEVIRNQVAAYGIAMGAGIRPNFKENTYTRVTDMSTWTFGKNANGEPNNTKNGTLLEGILSENASDEANARNAAKQIYTVPYIELVDGTRVTGYVRRFSLQNLVEGCENLSGIDEIWDTLPFSSQQPIIDLFKKHENVVKTWSSRRILGSIFGDDLPDTPYEDDGILKVLLIGHSLGLDSGYFFPEVYKEATGKDVVLGMLYHSGCPLYDHVNYLESNAKQYAYYEFDTRKDSVWRRAYANGSFHTTEPGTGNDTLIADGTIGVTMQFGIKRADWDLVITQAGVWEVAGKGSNAADATITKNIKTIREYVLSQDIEKRSTPEFGWNITWAPPSKESGMMNSAYDSNMSKYFNYDTTAMFNEISRVVQGPVMNAGEWDYIFPSGTALHNAKTVMSDKELYRDTVHASDFGRLMIAYIWTCKIEGTSIDQYDITSIYSQLRYSSADRLSGVDYELNDTQKANLKTFVRNALANPNSITQ